MFLPVILSFWIGGLVGVKAGFVCEITFSEKPQQNRAMEAMDR